MEIRALEREDNAAIAKIIRNALEEFGANKPGTVYFDPTTDDLFHLFSTTDDAAYFVAVDNGELLGGAGIYPTEHLPDKTCELVKMYLKPEARNRGFGKALILKSIEFAKSRGYEQVYLESMPELKKALSTYHHLGFSYIDHPLGNSGHFGCDLFMVKKI